MLVETGLVAAFSNPAVLQTLLGGMVVTSFVTALPKPGTKFTWGLIYKFAYDWLVGFISLKEGRPIPNTTTTVTETETEVPPSTAVTFPRGVITPVV